MDANWLTFGAAILGVVVAAVLVYKKVSIRNLNLSNEPMEPSATYRRRFHRRTGTTR